MPSYNLSVQPIAHARLTGLLGTLTAVYRNVTWTVELGGKNVTRNGQSTSLDAVPPSVYAIARAFYDDLRSAATQGTY